MKTLKGVVITGVALVMIGVAIMVAAHADRDITTDIVIDAPPAAVWAVLTQTDRYSEWNPMIDRIVGDLKVGNVVEVDQGMVFHPTILVLRPNQELRWRGYVWAPGILDGERRFVLVAENSSTHLIQGEAFTGALSGRLIATILDGTIEQMHTMNRALKTRVESLASHH